MAGKEVYITLASTPNAADVSAGSGSGKRGGGSGGGGGGKARGGGGGKDRGKRGGGSALSTRSARVRVGSTQSVRRACYLDWVSTCRALVRPRTRTSGARGRVGYIHVADMEESGYEHFTRQYLAEVRADTAALILDLRGNVGGITSDLLLARLTQRRLGREKPAFGSSSAVPEHAAPSGLVVLIDEFTSSDGECLAQYLVSAAGAFTVGVRTWGGVFAMGEAELVDGSVVNVPSVALSLAGSSPELENYGVAPMRRVEATPQDAVAGRDAQLEAAVAKAVELVEERIRVEEAEEAEEAERARARREVGGAEGARRRKHWSVE